MFHVEHSKDCMVNSCQKGKRGERAWRDELKSHGFLNSYRGQQFQGGKDSPDVICPELPYIHFEVKWVQALNLYGAVTQAVDDAGEKVPVVAHRKNNCEWLVTMRADDWLVMIKDTFHVKMVYCPDCHSSHVLKRGANYKGNQQYSCENKECGRTSFGVTDNPRESYKIKSSYLPIENP